MPTGNFDITCICSPRKSDTTTINSSLFSQPKQTTITQFFGNGTTDIGELSTRKASSPVPAPNDDKIVNADAQNSSLTIYYQNVRGLRTKQKEFSRNSSSVDYAVIALTETWLNSSIFSSEYFDHSFTVYRKDRESTRSTAELGGGTLIAVRDTLISSDFKLQGFDDIEHTCVKIRSTANSNIYIYVAYLPPPPPNELFARHLAAISSIPVGQSDTIFILGDFNIPHADWILSNGAESYHIDDEDEFYSMIPTNVMPSFALEFLHEIFALGCIQINSIFNDRGRLLDLVFTNDFSNIEVSTAPSPLSNIDESHPPLLLTCENQLESKTNAATIQRRNFHRADFVGLCNFLNDSHIIENIMFLSLEQKVAYLHEVLDQGISLFVPLSKRRRFKSPWWNTALQKLKNKRNKEWKRFLENGDRSSFDRAFSEFDALNTVLHNNYTSRMESSLREDPSSFWRFVKSKRNTNGLPKLLSYGSQSSTEVQQHASMFAEFFNENFTTNLPTRQSTQTPHDLSQPQLLLDEHFVFDELLKIKTSVNAGPDGIHPLVLKNCASVLFKPLTMIFNESLQNSVFPESWKRYSVTPIFKKGARSKVENYRCIAKLQTIAKFFEHCVNVHLVGIISPKISPHQHGFTKKRSANTNLMEFVHYSLNGLNAASRVDVLYLDFSKAFDRVNHNVLLRKLATFDVPNNVLLWLRSYLSNRRQYVKLGENESADFLVNSGVPQGSHIGPTIFLALIDDLPSVVSVDVFLSMYADDVRAAKTIKNQSDITTLQQSIDALRDWCNQNDLHLNLEKCSVLALHRSRTIPQPTYFYGDHQFSTCTEQRDLGIIIDSKFNYKNHVDMIVAKALSALGFVKRFCHDIEDQTTLKVLFSAFVQSKLDYCSTVWLTIPSTRANYIEAVLNKFTRFALREYPNPALNIYRISPYEDRLKRLDMISLNRRRINNALIFLYDLLNNNVHCPYVKELFYVSPNVRNLRDVERFRIIDPNLSRTSNAPITLICKYANCVKDIFSNATSRNNFKSLLADINDDAFL